MQATFSSNSNKILLGFSTLWALAEVFLHRMWSCHTNKATLLSAKTCNPSAWRMELGSIPHLWCSSLSLPQKSQAEAELFLSCLPGRRAALPRLNWSQTMASCEKTVVFFTRPQIRKKWLKMGPWSPLLLAVFPSISAGSATLTALPAAETSQELPHLWQCQVRHFCSQFISSRLGFSRGNSWRVSTCSFLVAEQRGYASCQLVLSLPSGTADDATALKISWQLPSQASPSCMKGKLTFCPWAPLRETSLLSCTGIFISPPLHQTKNGGLYSSPPSVRHTMGPTLSPVGLQSCIKPQVKTLAWQISQKQR